MNLHPYQREGVRFLATRRRAYLADTMGLGKSAQAIVAAGRVVKPLNGNRGTGRIVIVCPASAVPNWRNEWTKWNGPWHVDNLPGGAQQEWPMIVSYSSLIRRDWKSWNPDLTILDEAHYAKSPSAKRTRAALGLARASNYAWLLSGTPMPNNPTELWAAMKYLWPAKVTELGIRTGQQWMNHFCLTRPTIYGPKPYAVRNGDTLRGLLFGDGWDRVQSTGLMLRRMAGDVKLELPPLRVDLVRLPKNKAMVAALEDYSEEDAKEEGSYSTMRRLLGAAKAPLVARQIVEELDNKAYDKIVVLYHHRTVGLLLREHFKSAGYQPVGFDGSTSQFKRQIEIDEFQTNPKAKVFLAQQTSAGIAINLTAASELVLVEPAWTPAENSQAIKRVHRIGSERPVRARIFAVADTLDESVMDTIHRKVAMAEEIGLK